MAYIANLAIGKSDFEAINLLGKESVFKAAGAKNIPPEETVRQRMDEPTTQVVQLSFQRQEQPVWPQVVQSGNPIDRRRA